jgi:hypothetical protein
VALQVDQSDHDVSSHGRGFAPDASHAATSWTVLLQFTPPGGELSTARLRRFWRGLDGLHPTQLCHSSNSHASGGPQALTLQDDPRRTAPLQALPPPLACSVMRRICTFQPPPHVALQAVQSPQSDKTQSTCC